MKWFFGLTALLGLMGATVCGPMPCPFTSTASCATCLLPDSNPAVVQVATPAVAGKKPAVKLVALQEKWADLKAKIVVKGSLPAPTKIDASKDAFCTAMPIYTDDLIVSKEGGLKNLVLYMDKSSKAKDVHPDLEGPRKEPIVLDNKACVFVPHVFTVRPQETIKVTNSDATGHNANFSFFNNAAVNFLVPAGGSKDLQVQVSEPAPIPVECNVHPWMRAHVIVADFPYVGISDEAGTLSIDKLPAGEVTFRVWHERAKIDEVEINGKKEKVSRGRLEITLKPGMNDLGTITIDASKFK